jgi:hypothetical protein
MMMTMAIVPQNRVRQSPLLSRRDLLRSGAITGAVVAAAATSSAYCARRCDRSCIFLFLTGGPSHLDTFDPKPDAPAEVRGPFGSIPTSVPGIRMGELLPRTAACAQRWGVVRSVCHNAPAVHETGQQLLQTGRLSKPDRAYPHFGAVVSQRLGPRRAGVPPFVMLPGKLGDTGLNVSHGQDAGLLGAGFEPVELPRFPYISDSLRAHYGATEFGDRCLHACRLVERGVRCVVVNMFDTLYDRTTWDCHADRRCFGSTLDDYRRTLCPTFDQAWTALLDDLHQRGLLASTLVVAAGEFGRTPNLNRDGGRDHWPGVWSVLFAGGGVRGGQVIGASDKFGREPIRRAVRAEDVAATIYRFFQLDAASSIQAADGQILPLTEGRPIHELFS